jgi:RNA polymerase sigma-70 factor (ECF subfamily)
MGAAESRAPGGAHFELFEHEAVLRATAAHLCRKAWETDDLVQDTFERALRFLQSGHLRPAHLRAWLVSILRNAFIDRIRRKAVTFEPLADGSDAKTPVAPDADPEPAWAGLSLAEVQAALAELDEDQRRAFELHYLEGLSYRDVATRMAIPQNTVASRLFRARKALRRVLDRKMGGST